MSVRLRILGPLEVAGSQVRLPRQAQVLLGALLLRVGEVVSIQRLADEIWGALPPASWPNAVQVYVSRVRKTLLEAGIEGELRRHGPGYVLDVPPDSVDAVAFEQLSRAAFAMARDDPAGAAASLEEALELWRGRVLEGLTFESLASVEIDRLEEGRLAALEQRLDLQLATGRQLEVVPQLEQLVGEHPFRERFRCQLVLALYRAGRQADALAECRRARRFLVDELGLEPSEELRALERKVLRQDPALAVAAEAPSEQPAYGSGVDARRPVAAVCVRLLTEASDLDEELLDAVSADWEREVGDALERRGARLVELGPGEALGLFGVPSAHEDDALRACRTALGIRDGMLESGRPAGLGVALAVECGELLGAEVGRPRGSLLQSVRRLADREGVISLGPRVRELVADRVESTVDEGRVELTAVTREAEAIRRDLSRPLVGRSAELAVASRVLARAVDTGEAALLVISGPAGIGKSRIAAEIGSSSGDAALLLRARVLPEEQGLTFAPLAELASELLSLRDRAGLLALVAAEDDPEEIVSRFLALTDPGEKVTSSREETHRSVRKLFEGLALERPVIFVVEDLHWAEGGFLDLLEQLAQARGPIVIVCTARPQLLEQRPEWAGGDPRWSSVAVEPLGGDECAQLLASIRSELAERARARIVAASGGNPLFLEQLAAMEADWAEEGGELPLPASLRSLLIARLDTLDPDQRELLASASILADTFSLADLEALSEADPNTVVDGLVARDFLRPAESGALSFAHPLIRTTVYETVPKRRRADLHERYADLAGTLLEGGARDELVGHHLERAFRWRADVSPDDEGLPSLAARARERLAAAGRLRYDQGDAATAISLLVRARTSAVTPTDVPAALLLSLGDALREGGRLGEAETELEAAVAVAEGAGDEQVAWRARASLVRLQLQLPSHPVEEVKQLADSTLAELTRLENADGLALAWWVQGWLTWLECRAHETESALAQSIEWARKADNNRLEAHAVNLYLGAALFGPMPAEQAVERCTEFRRRHHDRQSIVASCVRALSVLRAMQGDFDQARENVAHDQAILYELGLRYQAAAATEAYGLVELLAGDPERAEHIVRGGYEHLVRMGDTNALPTIAALLGETLIALGRHDEALAITDEARQSSDEHDLGAQVQWRTAQAKALALRGRDRRARRVAGDAVGLAARTDFLNLHADALIALADVHRLASRKTDAVSALIQAERLYQQKGNVVSAARAGVSLRAARRLPARRAAASNVG